MKTLSVILLMFLASLAFSQESVPAGNDSGQTLLWNNTRWAPGFLNYFNSGIVTMAWPLVLTEIRPPSLGMLTLYGSLDIYGGHDSLKQIIFEKPDGAQYIHITDIYDSYHDTIPPMSGVFSIINSDTRGSDAFTTTAQDDTVTISGASISDYYFIQATGTGVLLSVDAIKLEATASGFIAHRGVAGTSGLTYNWRRMK